MTHRGPFQSRPFCDSVIHLLSFCILNITAVFRKGKIESLALFQMHISTRMGAGFVILENVNLQQQLAP